MTRKNKLLLSIKTRFILLIWFSVTIPAISNAGNVYNYAVGDIGNHAGAGIFTGSAASGYTLDFGTISTNALGYTANLDALNTAPLLFSDLIAGDFTIASGSGNFTLSGFNAFSNLGGQGAHALTAQLFSTTTGSFNEVINFNWHGYNPDIGSGYVGPTETIALTLLGNVQASNTPIPEPNLLALIAAGFFSFSVLRRKMVGA